MNEYGIADEFVEINIENELTKAVFGCLQLLGRDALNEVFSAPRFDFTFASAPDFTFHETVDKREPDVVVEDTPNLTLMVEAKMGAPTDYNQLSDEFDDLTQEWDSDKLRLLHITEERLRPTNLESRTEIPPKNLIWTSWRNLATSLLDIDKSNLTTADQRVVEMLVQILEKQGYRPFRGFNIMADDQTLTDQLNQAYQVREQYYKDINSFRKDVESHLPEEVSYWKFFRRGVSGGMGAGRKNFPTSSWQYLPRNLWFGYTPEEGPLGSASSDYHENYLILDFNSRSGDIRAGYSVTTSPDKVKNDIYRKVLHERRETVLDLIHETELEPFTTSFSLKTNIDTVEGTNEFLEAIGDSTYDNSSLGKRFILARTWAADELSTQQDGDHTFSPAEVPKDVAQAMEEIHQLTYHDYNDIFYPDPGRFE
ncbi:hypothetical protein [Haloarchaeobius sp. HRN-SO-5]|uniref:hypothetical protein n=1 Tax=Haloarchaeobius sp. HRN-SO-5 TaxID=3446118 RepID=UPI003EBC89E5